MHIGKRVWCIHLPNPEDVVDHVGELDYVPCTHDIVHLPDGSTGRVAYITEDGFVAVRQGGGIPQKWPRSQFVRC